MDGVHAPRINGHGGLEPGGQSERRKRKEMKALRRNPDAPKRFKSPYIFFSVAMRRFIKEEMPKDTKVTEIVCELATKWRELGAQERALWDAISRRDRARYEAEMADHQGPVQVPNKRPKKPKDAPKRSMSAFLMFSQENRPSFRERYPELRAPELSRLLAGRWHELLEHEKQPYLQREQEARTLYNERMKEYRQRQESQNGVHDHALKEMIAEATERTAMAIFGMQKALKAAQDDAMANGKELARASPNQAELFRAAEDSKLAPSGAENDQGAVQGSKADQNQWKNDEMDVASPSLELENVNDNDYEYPDQLLEDMDSEEQQERFAKIMFNYDPKDIASEDPSVHDLIREQALHAIPIDMGSPRQKSRNSQDFPTRMLVESIAHTQQQSKDTPPLFIRKDGDAEKMAEQAADGSSSASSVREPMSVSSSSNSNGDWMSGSSEEESRRQAPYSHRMKTHATLGAVSGRRAEQIRAQHEAASAATRTHAICRRQSTRTCAISSRTRPSVWMAAAIQRALVLDPGTRAPSPAARARKRTRASTRRPRMPPRAGAAMARLAVALDTSQTRRS